MPTTPTLVVDKRFDRPWVCVGVNLNRQARAAPGSRSRKGNHLFYYSFSGWMAPCTFSSSSEEPPYKTLACWHISFWAVNTHGSL